MNPGHFGIRLPRTLTREMLGNAGGFGNRTCDILGLVQYLYHMVLLLSWEPGPVLDHCTGKSCLPPDLLTLKAKEGNVMEEGRTS